MAQKLGTHRRGRKKGSVSKIDEEARRVAAATGITPLEYMLKVMRDTHARADRRDAMAIAAAPYMHAKLVGIKHSGDAANPMREVHRIERVIYDVNSNELIAVTEESEQDQKTIEGDAVETKDDEPITVEREAAE